MGAINMLGLAKRTGARIFQASTSEVYGDPLVHSQPESYRGHVNSTPLAPACTPGTGRVVSSFIVQALQGKDITIFGNGQQTRSFCHVSDLIDGFTKLMASDLVQPVNIGNEFTIEELAKAVIELTGSRSRLVNLPLPSDDPQQRRPDISIARDKLGWSPRVPPDEGLVKTIDYFDAMLSAGTEAAAAE